MWLYRSLAVPTGRTRLLGQLHAPEIPARSRQVLGVDGFALRRSRAHGTILLYVEISTPIDLRADRISETLAAWLTEHPGAEIICRDRGSRYARSRRLHRTRSRLPAAGPCKTCPPWLRKHATNAASARMDTPWTT
jgi:hypothetical protein